MRNQMISRTTSKLLTLALLACATLPVMAQGGMGMGGPGGGRGNRVGYLAGYLSLTDAQKTQATAIFDAAETAAEVVTGQLSSAHDALRAAIKAGKTDVELDTLSATIGTLQGQVTAIQAKAQSKFYAILTAEQKTKYDSMGGGMGGGPRGMQNRGPRTR